MSDFKNALLKLGINLHNQDNTVKNISEILEELSDVWDKLKEITTEKKDEIATKIIKKRNVTDVVVVKDIDDFDKQIDFEWIGKSIINKEYYVGYIFIDKPWYSSRDQWSYYIKYQVNTSSYGNQHWEECAVDANSIKPYTKRNMVWLNDIWGIDTLFVTPDYTLDNSEEYVLGKDVDSAIKKLSNLERR